MRQWMLQFALGYLSVVPSTGTLLAGAPAFHFDVSPQVACTRYSDPAFAYAAPQEELIEARCQVSVLTTDLATGSLRECLFHFYSPDGRMRVHDYLPKTALVTDIVGPIRVEQERDRTQGLQLSTGTAVESLGHLEVTGSANRRQAYSLAYDRLPPRETLAAVGTLGRGAGVYFKQARTSQTSLEGAREFVLILRVPRGWRAGYLRLVCQARKADGDRQPELAASASFLVPLHAAGDVEAQAAAEQLFLAERHLVAESQRQQRAIQQASRPSLAYELNFKEPRVPENWLGEILRRPPGHPGMGFESYLPPTVQKSIAHYRHCLASLPIAAASEFAEESADSQVKAPVASEAELSGDIEIVTSSRQG